MLLNQVEKAKQDDSLSDLSNLLGELKGMAIDMGTEIDRSVFVCLFTRQLVEKRMRKTMSNFTNGLPVLFGCRHNKAIENTYDDMDELTARVRGANARGRRLLGK